MSEEPASVEAQSEAQSFTYVRPGLSCITPYIITGNAEHFIDFLKRSFGGTECSRVVAPGRSILHAEVALGRGAIELSQASEDYPPAPAAVHLYVDDADATYERALGEGATSIYPVADQHWGDRQGAVRDQFGNRWYIAKAGWTPGPEGIPAVQPFLHLHKADKMIPFLEAAFNAEALGVAKSPEGEVLHGTIRIGNATLEIDEAHDGVPPISCYLHVYVADTDAAYAQALQAGASSVAAPRNEEYGDRSANVKDAWGNSWFISTYLVEGRPKADAAT